MGAKSHIAKWGGQPGRPHPEAHRRAVGRARGFGHRDERARRPGGDA